MVRYRLCRQSVFACSGNQRDALDVERRRVRHAGMLRLRPPEDLEIELRNPVAERRQVEVLEDDIGSPAIGRRLIFSLDRRDQRIRQLTLRSPVQTEVQPGLRHHLPVRPDPSDPQYLALAERDGEAHRIAVFPDGRAAAALAADILAVDRFEKAARPDQLTGDAHAPEDPRQGRTLARTHHPEAVDPPRLHRLRAEAHQLLVDHRAEGGADGLAEHHRRQSRHRASDGAAERGARRRQNERCHQILLNGKRKMPAIRRAQAGVRADSTTP